MNTTIVITAQTVAPTLAPSILLAHADMERHARGALEAAQRAGELLQRAKADLRHDACLPWLAAHTPGLSARAAQAYMRLAARFHGTRGA